MQPHFLCEISDYSIADYLQRQNATRGNCSKLTGSLAYFQEFRMTHGMNANGMKTSIPSTQRMASQSTCFSLKQ